MATCGHCGSREVTVAHVRQCAFGKPKAPEARPARTEREVTPAPSFAAPDGRYAVDFQGTLRFFKVESPASGKWVGWTFVKEQASDDLHAVKGERKNAVLAIISEDPEAAMLRYGREIGRCGHCGRTLTNEESRAVGIGPVCRSKLSF